MDLHQERSGFTLSLSHFLLPKPPTGINTRAAGFVAVVMVIFLKFKIRPDVGV